MHTHPTKALPENITRWLILSILLLRCLFLLIPAEPFIYPFFFRFSRIGIPTVSYVWVLLEHVTIIAILHLWWRDTGRKNALAFLLMAWLDAIDFIVTGNNIWFKAGIYPITNNVFMLACFLILSIKKTRH